MASQECDRCGAPLTDNTCRYCKYRLREHSAVLPVPTVVSDSRLSSRLVPVGAQGFQARPSNRRPELFTEDEYPSRERKKIGSRAAADTVDRFLAASQPDDRENGQQRVGLRTAIYKRLIAPTEASWYRDRVTIFLLIMLSAICIGVSVVIITDSHFLLRIPLFALAAIVAGLLLGLAGSVNDRWDDETAAAVWIATSLCLFVCFLAASALSWAVVLLMLPVGVVPTSAVRVIPFEDPAERRKALAGVSITLVLCLIVSGILLMLFNEAYSYRTTQTETRRASAFAELTNVAGYLWVTGSDLDLLEAMLDGKRVVLELSVENDPFHGSDSWDYDGRTWDGKRDVGVLTRLDLPVGARLLIFGNFRRRTFNSPAIDVDQAHKLNIDEPLTVDFLRVRAPE